MVNEIRIYFEGDPKLRPALGDFLNEVRSLARNRRIAWELIACKDGGRTYRSFQRAIVDYPDAFVILLVDSEGPVDRAPWAHLANRPEDRWDSGGASDLQCQLMVQAMEAWFVADPQALKTYYGQKFNEGAIPKEKDVEGIDKSRLLPALEEASRHTPKGKYHKTKHAPELLRRVSPRRVREASRHCDRLFVTLGELIS